MNSPTRASVFAVEAGDRPSSISTLICHLVLAGLVNAAIAAFLLFNLPASRAPSLTSLFVRAILFVVAAVLAGMTGARFYWSRSSAALRAETILSFRRFAVVNAEAWVWIPAIVLLSRQDSPNSAVLSALGAVLLSNGLRRVFAEPDHPQTRHLSALEFNKDSMFAATLESPPHELHGYLIAFALYLAGYLLIEHFYLIAGIPLAFSAFFVAWKLTLEPAPASVSPRIDTRTEVRLASVATAAVLVTFFVLLLGVARRNRILAAGSSVDRGGGEVTGRNPKKVASSPVNGFESIILWPVPEKKRIVAPRPANISSLATRSTKPLVIHFDGAYWYFQPPDKGPGTNAHKTYGSPLAVDIGTNNFFPLTMQAVQTLSAAIRFAPYREIQVSIENRDNVRGPIALYLLLTDTSAPGKPTLSLGAQPVLSSEPDRFSFKSAPTEEVLRFSIPERTTIRKFTEIKVIFLPDAAHFAVGPRIAIQQFAFVPR